LPGGKRRSAPCGSQRAGDHAENDDPVAGAHEDGARRRRTAGLRLCGPIGCARSLARLKAARVRSPLCPPIGAVCRVGATRECGAGTGVAGGTAGQRRPPNSQS
jgi:hypothetical protein